MTAAAAMSNAKQVIVTRLGNLANRLSAERLELKSELELIGNPAYAISAQDCADLDLQYSADQIAALIAALEALDALLDTHGQAIAEMRLL